jgi:hypothetical protein
MIQGILHIPTGRWLGSINENGYARLYHDPNHIGPDYIQQFGDTKLHSVLNQLRKRDQWVIRSFSYDLHLPLKVR